MKRDLTASAIAVVAFTLIFGLAYPLITTGVAQLFFPGNSDGSQIERDGTVIGSKLIGQDFAKDPAYFQSRPSATGYSADVTYFNNLGPNNAELSQLFKDNIESYIALERPTTPD